MCPTGAVFHVFGQSLGRVLFHELLPYARYWMISAKWMRNVTIESKVAKIFYQEDRHVRV